MNLYSLNRAGRRALAGMVLIAILAIALSLSGCATTEQIEAQQDAMCRRYGAPNGTPDQSNAYWNCRLIVAQNAATQAALDQQRSAGLIAAGAIIASSANNAPPPPPPPMQSILPPPPIRCSTFGGVTTCR